MQARWSVVGLGGGPMVGGLLLLTLGVDCFRSRVLSEHPALQILEEVRAIIQAGVGGVDIRVALWRDDV